MQDRFRRFISSGIPVLWVAEYGGIIIQFLIFRRLYSKLAPIEFAQWEWLQIWLGILLLIPRNGLDIIAIRTANRHPRRIREWTAIVILIRGILSPCAALLFFMTGRELTSTTNAILVPLSLTIIVSAISPEIACRAQSRFQKYARVVFFRQFLFLILISFHPSLSIHGTAWAYLMTELFVCGLWWHDTHTHKAWPGRRFGTLLRRSQNAIIARSLNQTFGRWLRVTSWSADALILGLLAPEQWAVIAPARRILMTAVIPFSNWLGVLAPSWSKADYDVIYRLFQRFCVLCMGLTVVVCMTAMCAGSEIVAIVMTPEKVISNELLALMAARFAPFAIGLVLASGYTVLRCDTWATIPALLQTVAQCTAGLVAWHSGNAFHIVASILVLECLGLCIPWYQWGRLKKPPTGVKQDSQQLIPPVLRSQNLYRVSSGLARSGSTSRWSSSS